MPAMYLRQSSRSISASTRSRWSAMYVYDEPYGGREERERLDAPYRHGPMGMNILCHPTSVYESIALSQVGDIEVESMLPPLFFMALYAAKKKRCVQEKSGLPCSAYASGSCHSS